MTIWPEIISDDPEMMADWESLSVTEKATIEEAYNLENLQNKLPL